MAYRSRWWITVIGTVIGLVKNITSPVVTKSVGFDGPTIPDFLGLGAKFPERDVPEAVDRVVDLLGWLGTNPVELESLWDRVNWIGKTALSSAHIPAVRELLCKTSFSRFAVSLVFLTSTIGRAGASQQLDTGCGDLPNAFEALRTFLLKVQSAAMSLALWGWLAANSGTLARAGRTLVITVYALNFIAGTAVAQGDPSTLCQADALVQMVEGFFRFTTALGAVGLPVMWQATYLIDLLGPRPEERQRLESYRRSALKSALLLFLLGPLYTVAGSMMGFPMAPCIDLVPDFSGG